MAKKDCILIADDAAIDRRIVRMLLRRDYDVEEAADGLEAVKHMEAHPDGYACILLDMLMPVMDGFEAARRIRALAEPALSHLPIIAMTANAFDEDRRAAARCGMNGLISKPIDMEELLETLHGIFG